MVSVMLLLLIAITVPPSQRSINMVNATTYNAPGSNPTVLPVTLTVVNSTASHNIPLAAGWNLVSLPLIPENTDPAAVISASNLASGNINNVSPIYLYDTATTPWKYWVNGAGTLTTMEDGPAYWIYANVADTLTVHGTEAAHPGPDYPVLTGWNMVGFTSTTGMSLEAYLTSIDGSYDVVYRWNAGTGTWSYWTVTADNFDIMDPGYGYWLHMNADGIITPP